MKLQKETLPPLMSSAAGEWNLPPRSHLYGTAVKSCMILGRWGIQLGSSSLSGYWGAGSLWLLKNPHATPNEDFCSARVHTEARMTDLLWVGDRGTVASDSHTVGLWELDEDEILVSKACEYEQDATVSAVSVLNPGTRAVKAGDLADGTEFTPGSLWACHLCCSPSLQGLCFFPAVRTIEFYCGIPCPKPASLMGCIPWLPSHHWLDILSRVRSCLW